MARTDMITPDNCAMVLIDFQPAMWQGVESHQRIEPFTNVQILAKTAKLFKLPIVLSTVAKDSFSGPFMPEVTDLFPSQNIVDRTSINSWLDAHFRIAVLSEDYFEVPADRIRAIESLCTVVDGTVVHAAGAFASHAPPTIPVLPEWSPVAAFGGHWRVAANASLPPTPVVCSRGHAQAPLGRDTLSHGGQGCSCWAY